MALITNSDAFDTEFTPAAGDFIASATLRATLMRKNAAAGGWAVAGLLNNQAVIVDNPISGAVYKWAAGDATCAVRADQ